MTAQDTTPVEIRDNAYGTIPGFWWGWPDEARLAEFAGKDDQIKRAEKPLEDDPAYATLYFVA